jgi:ABC-2 type transport system permease protein
VNARPWLESARVELLLFVREPMTVVFALVMPVVFVVVLSGVFGDTPDPNGEVFRGVGGSTYYTPAYIGLAAASVGLIILPTHLAGYRERGVLRRIRAAGVPVTAVLLGQLAVTLALSVAGGVLVTVVAFLASTPEAAVDPWGVVVAGVVGALAFGLLGLALGALLPTARAAQGAGILLWFLVFMLGGAGPPPEVLPDAMSTVGDLTPLRPLIIALQDPWFGNGWNVGRLGVLVAIGAVSWAVAGYRLSRD